MRQSNAPTAPAPGTNVPATFAETVAYTLHRAAAAYRVGEIRWGREHFIRPDDGCRCALGAITYAVDPATGDGNPHYLTDPAARNVAEAAAEALAVYLVHELDAIPAYEGRVLDVVETVGNWNDETARDATQVADALDAAGHQA